VIRPGPAEGPRSFEAAKPAPGSDRGGRPAKPNLQAAATPLLPVMNPLLAKYGKYPSMGNPHGIHPDLVPGQEEWNPFERRWIQF